MASATYVPQRSIPTASLEAYVFDNARLLTKDGEIDEAYLRRTAKERAFFKYGSTMRQLDVAFQLQRCRTIAEGMRDQYRREHGLTEDAPVYVAPYGKEPKSGVRWSVW